MWTHRAASSSAPPPHSLAAAAAASAPGAPSRLTAGADTTVTSGNCYRYRYRVADNVGNVSNPSAASADAKIDTTAPIVSNNAPTPVTGGGAQYYDSGTETLYFRPSGSGSFQLNATASDGQSDVASVEFPDLSALNGFSGSGGTDASSPYASTTYSWTSGASGDPGGKTVTATNSAGGTATTTITITPDSTAPTGQTAALSGGPYYSSTSVPLTLANGSDSGAGIDSSSGVVERDSATLTGGTCGSFGSWSTVTLSGGADTTVVSGNCYRYRYSVADLVGNVSAPSSSSTDAKIDTTAPAVAATTPTAVTGAGSQHYAAGNPLVPPERLAARSP